jgi:hypothetical protein
MKTFLALTLAASLMAGAAWAQSAGSGGGGGSSAAGGNGSFRGGSSAAGGSSSLGIGGSSRGSFGASRPDTPQPGPTGRNESLGVGSGSGIGNDRTLGSQSAPLDTPKGPTQGTRCPPGQSASITGGCVSSADPSSRRTLPSDMAR